MTAPTTALTCPKCAGQMRAYERSGITIDQCTDCRGIFLDRGELERLIDAEDTHYGGGSGRPGERAVPPGTDPRAGYDDGRSGDEGDRARGGGERRRRGGFLGDLLDFGD